MQKCYPSDKDFHLEHQINMIWANFNKEYV